MKDMGGVSADHRPVFWTLLLPPLAALTILFVAPLVMMFVYSFWSVNNDYQLVRSMSLMQYEKVFREAIYLGTLLGSAWMALLTTLVCLALSLPLAYFIARFVPRKWRVLLIVGLIIPGWISILIRTYSMNLVIGESGLLNWLLLASGLVAEPVKILFTKTAVVLGLVYIYLPYTMVPIYAALERLDPRLLEAAENLGANPFRRFIRITLPLILPGIVAGAVITFIPALGEYLVPNLLGGLQGTMYGNLIATAFLSFDWPLGSALSVVLMAGVLALLWVVTRVAKLDRGLLPE
jgi:ABC-type spermidine/putrescine transport system permease subunit I